MECEIVVKCINPCAGAGRPQTYFEETEVSDTDAYVQAKHRRDFSRAVKWMQGDVIRYRLDAGGVVYEYEFTPI